MVISGHCETQSQIKRNSPLRASEEPEVTAVCERCERGDSFHEESGGTKDQRMLRSDDGHTEVPHGNVRDEVCAECKHPMHFAPQQEISR